MNLTRGLKAVLFSDMKGYSAKMSHDENRAFSLMQAHDRLVTPVVDYHRGRLVKKIGDAITAAFETASDAVNCAVEILRVLAASNEGKATEDQILIRIGIREIMAL